MKIDKDCITGNYVVASRNSGGVVQFSALEKTVTDRIVQSSSKKRIQHTMMDDEDEKSGHLACAKIYSLFVYSNESDVSVRGALLNIRHTNIETLTMRA